MPAKPTSTTLHVGRLAGAPLGIVSLADLHRRLRADEIASPAPRLAA